MENKREKIRYENPIEIEFYDWCENNLKTTSDISPNLIVDWLKESGYPNTIRNSWIVSKVYIDFLKYNFKNIEMK